MKVPRGLNWGPSKVTVISTQQHIVGIVEEGKMIVDVDVVVTDETNLGYGFWDYSSSA